MRTSITGRHRFLLPALVACTVVAGCGSSGGDSAEHSSAISSATASATSDAAPTYLALGDSVAFGYQRHAEDYGHDFATESDFVGYPQLIGEQRDLDVLNTACPGETTASFLDTTAQSNGCTNALGAGGTYRDSFPLHEDYDGSQMDEAITLLGEEPDIQLVTLQLGANDAFVCQGTGACSGPGALDAITTLAEQARVNVDQILTRIEGAGYTGTIVVVTYYVPDYDDVATVFGITKINDALEAAAAAHGALVADAFPAFEAKAQAAGGSSVDAGLVLPDDIHPSPDGQELLAQSVEDVLP